MWLPAITAMLALIGAAAASTTSMKACSADNCLRAVQASGFPTRHGSADCSSYFLVTVTPATTTIITTITHFSSSTNRAVLTSTSTLDVTTTPVSDVAATSLLDVTSTSIVDVTATSTVEVAGSEDITKERRNLDIEIQGVAPRQATVKPSSIPAYASPCSGAARYSSACSCLGVTARTTTIASPSTTKTVTSIRTTVVATVTTIGSTATTTVIGATSIITTTTGIITNTITVSTTTTTVTDSTTSTTTTTAPAASDCAPGQSISTFILMVGNSGTVFDGQYAVLSTDGDYDMASFSSNEDDATVFNFNDVCNVESNSEIASVAPESPASDVFFNLEEDITNYGFVAATCTVAVDDTLTCIAGSNTIFVECEDASLLHLASYIPQGCQALSLIAIAV